MKGGLGWLLRLSSREIVANPRFSVFFCLNLVLGLVGLIALDAFKVSLQTSMASKSRVLLGADLAVSARRPFSEDEVAKILQAAGPHAKVARALEFYTMIRGKKASRLTEMRAIENAYPFYGRLTLEDGRVSENGKPRELEESRSLWLSPELALQLGVQLGEEVDIGEAKFRITGIVADDTSNSWRGFSLASPGWIGFSKAEETGLIRQGSNVSRRFFFLYPPGTDLTPYREALEKEFPDPSVRITTHERASDQVGRTVDYVNDYLGLVSLVALFFAALGATYLFRSHLTKKLSEIAILMTLGVPNHRAAQVFWVQLAGLGFMAALIATALASLLLPGMNAFIREFLLVPIDATLSLSSVGLAFFLGTVGSVLICLPLLTKVERLKPAQLFSEEAQPEPSFDRKKAALGALLMVVFWGLACWQAKSWFVGSLFVVGFCLAGAGLTALALAILSALRRLSTHGWSLRSRLAIRNLSRARLSSLSSFLALGLGSLLLNLIPQIQGNIQSEIEAPTEVPRPSLFLFDVLDEQVSGLRTWLSEQKVRLDHLSPMIRARLTQVNGKPFERDDKEYQAATREEERDARSKNRMFNLSFRGELADSETLVKGRSFTGAFDPAKQTLPEITLETRFADRLKLAIGDELTFDVEGVPVSGVVVGTRRVNWMSFQPNFFVVFQPGALDEAPKTWLGAVSGLSREGKVDLQNAMVERFTNVSVVDVENTVSKILSVFSQIGLAIRLMAILTLIAGMAVIFSIANHQANSRKRETSLLKVLGARFDDVESTFMREILWIALGASLVGSVLSLAFSFVLVNQVFDVPWHPDFRIPLLSVAAISIVSILVSRVGARRALQVKPIALLQDARE